MVIILYFESCRVFKAEEFDLIISARDYYNFIWKMVSDKNKLEIINDLLIVL